MAHVGEKFRFGAVGGLGLLLRLFEGVLDLLSARNVLDDTGEHAALVRTHLPGGEFEREQPTVLAPPRGPVADAGDEQVARREHGLAVILAHQDLQVLADDLVGLVAEDGHRHRIE